MTRREAYRPATLLVPGWSDTFRELQHARAFLLESGWPPTHVHCVNFGDRYGSNIDHAAELAAQAERLLLRSGELELAIVAHSMGGLAARYYLGACPAAPVHTVIFAGTPHRGTWLAWAAWGRGGAEMRPGSAFLRALAERPLPSSTRAVCVRTYLETRVIPGNSTLLEGAACHMVRRPTHPRMLRHRPTLRLIRDVLLEPWTGAAAA